MSRENVSWITAFILNLVILGMSYILKEPVTIYNSTMLIGIAYLIFKGE